MCVHDVKEDMYVSGELTSRGIWEEGILRSFVSMLEKFPNAGVIDVGAQLGMYGLQAVQMKRRVCHENCHFLFYISPRLLKMGLGDFRGAKSPQHEPHSPLLASKLHAGPAVPRHLCPQERDFVEE
jgi:hypothetical protein